MDTVRFDVHERAHIVVDGSKCEGCSTQHCVVACPANLFVPTSDGGIVFNYEQCFECGTCYLVCNVEARSPGPIPTADTASCSGGPEVTAVPSTAPAVVAVCLKWTPSPFDGGPLGPDEGDDRFAGVSPADRAALELALQLSDAIGASVTAIAAGPSAADRVLRDAVAAGATRAVRLDMAAGSDSRDVAFELAQVVADACVVLCGDYSLDRGSGAVPAFVAHHRRCAQALGLVSVDVTASASSVAGAPDGELTIHAVRRLDGGRREVLAVPTPCVLSVEGSVASLRRARCGGRSPLARHRSR
ncbi:MAG: 4Fe-4S dicluster domain-containing protein [Ilumatobacteraceae bacterium]